MPGWISASGLAVSTVVETMAMNQPLVDTYDRTLNEFSIANLNICSFGENHADTHEYFIRTRADF